MKSKKFIIILLIIIIVMYKRSLSQIRADIDQTLLETEQIVTEEAVQKETEITTKMLIKVSEDELNLYQKDTTESDVLEKINLGELLELQETVDDWHYVLTNQGQYGYVESKHTKVVYGQEKERPTSLKEAVIVIDPGHGGEDTGAISNSGYIFEKDVTLSTAQILANRLEEEGSTVILTRQEDTFETLSDICQVSNENDTDIFISLHYDSSAYMNEATGTTTYYYYEKDKELAENINNSLADTLPLENRGVEYGNFQVLRENTQASLLLELGYMNSDSDVAIFSTSSYQTLVAEAIITGLQTYFQSDTDLED